MTSVNTHPTAWATNGRPRWRDGKVRPSQGNAPQAGFYVGRISTLEGAFTTIPSTPPRNRAFKQHWAPNVAFSEASRNLSVRYGRPKPESEPLPPAGSSNPDPRASREEHALLIVPMSSGRLFLDRVGRHQSPSPLRRHAQTNTHFPSEDSKPEHSILLGRGTFYFALTRAMVEDISRQLSAHWRHISAQRIINSSPFAMRSHSLAQSRQTSAQTLQTIW
jgi:hypothetical protein